MHCTVEAQERIRDHIQKRHPNSQGLLALDATTGNGFDTLFLAELVGKDGRVLAIDLQDSAIRSAKHRVEQADINGAVAIAQIDWIVGCHSDLESYLQETVGLPTLSKGRCEEELSDPSHGAIQSDDLSKKYHPLNIVMFNLGYLPLGDKKIITSKATTLKALNSAFALLAIDGILSVLSYPGHAGGSEEHQAVTAWFEAQADKFDLSVFRDEHNSRSPVLWLAIKK